MPKSSVTRRYCRGLSSSNSWSWRDEVSKYGCADAVPSALIGTLPPLCKIRFDLLRPFTVDLARRILAFAEALVAKAIAEADLLGALHDLLGEVGRDKDDTGAGAEDDVAGKHGRLADADRDVQAGERDIGEGRRVDAAHEGGEVGDLVDALQVTEAGIDDHPGLAASVDGGGEVVAGKRPVFHLPEEIDHDDIVFDERVDHPRVLA